MADFPDDSPLIPAVVTIGLSIACALTWVVIVLAVYTLLALVGCGMMRQRTEEEWRRIGLLVGWERGFIVARNRGRPDDYGLIPRDAPEAWRDGMVEGFSLGYRGDPAPDVTIR